MKFPSLSSRGPTGTGAHAPGIRAVVGGVLVAAASFGVIVAPGSETAPRTTFLVTTVDVAAGEALVPSMVEDVAVRLPADLAATALRGLGDEPIVAAVTLGEGTLVQRPQIRAPMPTDVTGPQITVTLASTRLPGRLDVGHRLDLLATYGSATDGFTTVVAAGATVLDVTETDSTTLGVLPAKQVGLRLDPDADVLAVAHASAADALTAVRAQGGRLDTEPYRPLFTPAEDQP